MNGTTSDINTTEYKKAEGLSKMNLVDIPDKIIDKYQMGELEVLLYEFKKLLIHTILEGESRVIGIDGFDTSTKTRNSRKISNASTIYDNNIISRESLGVPSEDEINMLITELYQKLFPGKGKTVIFDRTRNNRALVQNIYKYCTKEQYQIFMESLQSELERFTEEGYEVQNFFFYISKEVQVENLEKRKHDPLRGYRYSESDKKAPSKYKEIKKEIPKLAKIYEKAGIPFTLINTEDKNKGLINLLKKILEDLDYRNKSKKDIFEPDRKIVKSTTKEILEYTNAGKIK